VAWADDQVLSAVFVLTMAASFMRVVIHPVAQAFTFDVWLVCVWIEVDGKGGNK
jgi:hypothetical protein